MDVNCDEGLEFGSLDLVQILCCDRNKQVEQVQESLIRGLHHLLVRFGVVNGVL